MNPRRLAASAFITALLAITASCSDPVEPPRDLDQPPHASSPEAAVRRLAWAWTHRDTVVLNDVLAGNYTFLSARPNESGGMSLHAFTRGAEVVALARLLVTGHRDRPPALSVSFEIDSLTRGPVLLPPPDTGGSSTVVVSGTLVDLDAHATIRLTRPDFESGGELTFSLVRGDSAQWPPGVPHGPEPDSTRWFVRWWAEWFDTPAPTPDTLHSLAALKSLYSGVSAVSAPEWARSLGQRRRAR